MQPEENSIPMRGLPRCLAVVLAALIAGHFGRDFLADAGALA